MGATILLNKKLKEAWIGENKGKNSEIKENNNLKAFLTSFFLSKGD